MHGAVVAGAPMRHLEDQQWLADGRLVVVARAADRDGCHAAPGNEREMRMRFA